MKTVTLCNAIMPEGFPRTGEEKPPERVDIRIRGSRIDSIQPSRGRPLRQAAGEDRSGLIDLKGLWVMPGLIDPHVHVRDMEGAHKETWRSASAAALRGGYTRIMDMPNSAPPLLTPDVWFRKRSLAGEVPVKSLLWAGVGNGDLRRLEDLIRAALNDEQRSGRRLLAGIKVFFSESSSGIALEDPAFLRAVFSLAARYRRPVAVHSEMAAIIDADRSAFLKNQGGPNKGPSFFEHKYYRSRRAAYEGTKQALEMARESGALLYLCHVSTAEETELLRRMKGDVEVYAEVTPHHLLLTDQVMASPDLYPGFGKVNPPLREESDSRALQQALAEGVLDIVGSDHAPHTLEEKRRPYPSCPSGIPGLETTLPLLLQHAAETGLAIKRLQDAMAVQPAALFGLSGEGRVAAGTAADLIIVDPHVERRIEPVQFLSRGRYSPFQGWSGRGKVIMTLIEGEIIRSEE